MNASGRRQRQARNGYRHIHRAKRPMYKVRDAQANARRLRMQVEKMRLIQMRKGASKKA